MSLRQGGGITGDIGHSFVWNALQTSHHNWLNIIETLRRGMMAWNGQEWMKDEKYVPGSDCSFEFESIECNTLYVWVTCQELMLRRERSR